MISLAVTFVCRFSYLGDGGFQVEHESLEARAAFLYDRKRLLQRFAWFEHVTLPAIRYQTDPNFTFLLMTGDSLPDWALEKLRALLADVPQAVIMQLPPMRHRDACHQAMTDLAPIEGATHYALTRLDDDDAVALDYVERLRLDFGPDLQRFWARNRMLALDYTRGMVLEQGADDGAPLDPRIMQLATAGLALIFGPHRRADLFRFAHHKLAGRMTVLSQEDDVMFVRGVHGQNDSNASGQRGLPWEIVEIDLDETLIARFAIERANLAAALKAAELS
ncbi:glycosyltransferase [Ketogulonicigenium vulgare]|uniref:DNA-directed RNA polymerase subunit beta n=1 Tax=Ketogulonicigenium vulgare (strain WSH-001) TaxID=759362 RepID=F9Y5E4_KETVW|nr:glycosyltransferase [Ketogulonicigenium vulgare]ADO43680.1 conserved hypothetical protein [Ketogulonicigenium vulgare Y25]AEM41949.1 DNA-directed RNA polymerase subunit beta' [Ketogulonicigenium vulgare WSH-001]ALJ82050.1 DNA-directed RNA polymerase subunit beta' [Ketogulonicigenium vulgare]ANW34679.1 DNA-directed RNA polymerase subunit beta' [Ketogulonicigenium vulgare]AOZ55714.1 DNA-directed RNA polymerase subunit beta' [Ketogulonicigenium vulgare]